MTERLQRVRRADSIDLVDRTAPLRFGVIGGTSMVARLAVIPAIMASDLAELSMVASRTPEAIAGVGEAQITSDYADVLGDPEVDAVYIPLPNGLHRPWVERAAAAGKHVLVEKPMALTAADAEAMVAASVDASVVLMEAYMSPFHARNVALADLVASGRLGELRTGRAVFSFVHRDPTDHRWDPDLGGGALADVGIYVLTPLFDVAGSDLVHHEIRSVRTQRGVDATTTGLLSFANGFSATFVASMELPERQRLELVGTEGAIAVDRPFTAGTDDTVIELTGTDGAVEHLEIDGNDSYRSMIDHFCSVVAGRSTLRRPTALSVGFARLLEATRTST
ncbi:MAG TPA: Gfo/Idh/MocA family oxidoreductase [Acidimicrobiales bacterium]|nr:Gfo/Idh/MocA family oxidoreductase [Acidimicrobiales bacterium]